MSVLGTLFRLEFCAFHFIVWGDLLNDLNQAEYGDASIARLLNLPITTIRSWRDRPERDPRFAGGLSLLQLHASVFGVETTQKRITDMREAATRTATVYP